VANPFDAFDPSPQSAVLSAAQLQTTKTASNNAASATQCGSKTAGLERHGTAAT